MKAKKLLSVLIMLLMIFSFNITSFAHPGRTDANGGHYNRKTGEYHYHNGGSSSSSNRGSSSSKSKYSSSSKGSGSSSSSKSNYSSGSKNSSTSTTVPKKIYATKVTVSNMPSSIKLDESVQLKASVYPSNAEDKTLSWESSDTSVATVDSKGKLKAVGIGTAKITAKTSRGTGAEYTIKVKAIEAKSISIVSKPSDILIGDTVSLSAKLTPANTTDKTVKWQSKNTDIVSVDKNGKLTALAVGKTKISVIHKDLSDSFEIEVKPIEAEKIEIFLIAEDEGKSENGALKIEKGQKLEFRTNILPENTTDTTVTWSVDDSSIAEIDKDGVLTGLAKGKVVIAAETVNGITDTIEVEVYESSSLSSAFSTIVGLGVFAAVIVLLIKFIKNKKK